MSSEVTTAEKIRLLPWNTALGAANSVFVQLTFFGSAFILFLNELGASNSQIGVLLSMMPFFGIIALFIAPRAARFGYKRTYVLFFGLRKVITIGLVFVPWVLNQYGPEAALTLVTIVMIGFALTRAVAEVGMYPWSQEYIPAAIRGRHSALNDMVSRVTGIIAISVGGYILGLSSGLDRFVILFVIALIFGALAVWFASHLPGGAPIRTESVSYRGFFRVLRDRNFTMYLVGLGMVTFGGAPLAFLPLFMQREVGLNDSAVVWLQIGTIVGGLSATYLLGWASDRYGSKPVMMSGLYVKTLLPIAWLLMPREGDLSLPIALGIAAVWGIVQISWMLGSGRLLFTRVVPLEHRGEYMAVFYAAIGLIGGTSQIVSGALLDATAGLDGSFLIFPIDQFTPLFLISLVLTIVSITIFSRVQAGDEVSVGEFAGLFMHGNPVIALENVMRYYRARSERATVAVTERMGQTRSPLAVDELLEALQDPRFNVRFEAIVSIGRMGPEPRLVAALTRVLDGTEISLSVVAAWALGRLGDESALPTLRAGLESDYRSLQAHCARALGTLNDQTVAPLLLNRLQTETDKGLRMAFASALGNLRHTPALPALFDLMEEIENEGARMELALAIARVVDAEADFIRLWRALRNDTATSAAQQMMALRRRIDMDDALRAEVQACAGHFARGALAEAVAALAALSERLTPRAPDDPYQLILQASIARLTQPGGLERLEQLLLALLTFGAIEEKARRS
jgi:HEAT repeat protein/MFS family permease